MKREINLITNEFAFDPLGKIKPIILAVWLGSLVLLLGGLILAKEFEIRNTRLESARISEQLSRTSLEENDLEQFIQKNGQSDTGVLFQNAIPWVDILSTIGTIVPEGTWLKTFDGGIRQEGKDQPPVKQMKLAGFAYSHAPITLLLSRLERQSLFSDIHLIYTQKGETLDDRYVHFEITGRMN
ncbi:MAG: PilN domain-containing protein [Nitrospirae bacterium]|nr:PilN domain-containing protein [Nitrospirota bacterium]